MTVTVILVFGGGLSSAGLDLCRRHPWPGFLVALHLTQLLEIS